MKKIFLASTLLTISLLSFSQHVLYLKNGEKLSGEMLGGKKDSVFFSFYGNKIIIAHNDITSLYFNAASPQAPAPTPAPNPNPTPTTAIPTPAAAAVVATTNPAAGTTPEADGNIRGVITYYLTKSNTTKPDVGARVIIVDSASVPEFNLAVIDTFHFGNSYREIYNQYKISHTKVPRDIPEQMMIWKSDTKTSFDLLSRRAYKNISMIKKAPNSIKAITDEKGQFNVPIKPGSYYVYIISSYAMGETIVDLDGKAYCKKITVKSNDEAFIRNSFDVF